MSVSVYGAAVIAAGILPNCERQIIIMYHVWLKKSEEGGLFIRLTIRQLLALQYMQWQCQTENWFLPRQQLCQHSLGSCNSVCLSVCPSVTRMLSDKTKQCTADILIPHERAIIPVFCHQQWSAGDAAFCLKSALKVTHPPSKNADFDQFPLITSQP